MNQKHELDDFFSGLDFTNPYETITLKNRVLALMNNGMLERQTGLNIIQEMKTRMYKAGYGANVIASSNET